MENSARGGMTNVIWIGIVLLALAAPVITYWQSKVSRIQSDGHGLIVGGGIYRVEIPYEDIAFDGVIVGPAPETSLSVRTNGIGWPGFGLGWFRNKAGERVFALVRSGQLVYIPTRLDFNLVISVDDGDKFVEELREREMKLDQRRL